MDWTRSVGVVALVVVVATSGCIGFVTGEEPLVYEANQVSVSDDAKQATGYEQQLREEVVVNQTVSGRDVSVHNWYARYEKYDDIAEETTGVLTVFSTHRVDVFGHTTNPYANMSYSGLVANLTSERDTSFGSLEDATLVENETATVLGQDARVGVFTTNTTFGGEQVQVRLYVTRVQHGDDIVVAIGGHPTKLPAGEQEVMAMLEGIEHETDENATANERLAGGDAPAAVASGPTTGVASGPTTSVAREI
ncbi:hypothetical protein G9C85_13380 [Halorubellus sp. JP-L1]|uniref:DUF6517 family protein n=1 Tax=Halorubellus sp. JP-L1 TaxID=2715753 RepID=UPI0014088E5E|nr:DUF6517 family protein [Halorubellus sp. JP-L1]NHN42613.1 hypothetical protein [Halorubellus sp. JP-L1]